MLLKWISFVCLTLLQCACAYRSYRSKIPNGNAVPYPCKPNNVWEGVGHMLDQGTGVRNSFGLDFQTAGHVWTPELCRKDSDGDGMTNGQELGDPDCTWTENFIPTRTTRLSHPGICDPWDSPSCLAKPVVHPVYKTQADWMREECKAQEFVCAAKDEPGVNNLTIHMPSGSHVPLKETTYMCQIYDLENLITPGDYHMIAVEPVIDNVNVLHHMVLYGCTDYEKATNSSFECGMVASSNCQDFLSVWTVGLSGDCSHPSAGVRIGVNGYKRIALQVHWNNPDKISNWTDNSGLRLYYTPNRRTFDAGIILTGSSSFELPPRQASVTVKSTCTKGCTSESFQGPINVTMAWNHMHYAGIQMNIQVFRNNSPLIFLTNDPEYSYDSPQVYSFTDNPIILLPGDEIVTTCTYTTAKLDHSVLQGKATSEEMCFGFLGYYPKQNVAERSCLTGGPDFSLCDANQWVERGCRYWEDFYLELYQGLVSNCQQFTPCLQECVHFIVQATRSNACLQGDNWEFIKRNILNLMAVGRDIMALMASCPVEVYLATHSAANTSTTVTLATQSVANTSTTVSLATQSVANTSTPVTLPTQSATNTSTTVSLATQSVGNTSTTVSLATQTVANTSTTVTMATQSVGNTSTTVSLATQSVGNTSTTVTLATQSVGNTSTTVSLATQSVGNTSATVSLATQSVANTSNTTPTNEGGMDAVHAVSAGGLLVILVPALVLLLGLN